MIFALILFAQAGATGAPPPAQPAIVSVPDKALLFRRCLRAYNPPFGNTPGAGRQAVTVSRIVCAAEEAEFRKAAAATLTKEHPEAEAAKLVDDGVNVIRRAPPP